MHNKNENQNRIIAFIMTVLLVINLLSGVKHGGVVFAEGNETTVAPAVAMGLDSVDGTLSNGASVDGRVIKGSKVELSYVYDVAYEGGTYICKYTISDNGSTPSATQEMSGISGILTIENPAPGAGEAEVNHVYRLNCWAEDSVSGEKVLGSEIEFSFVLGNTAAKTTLSFNDSIAQETVVVTYGADKAFEGESYKAYRKVVKKATNSSSSDCVIVEGEITLGEGQDFYSCEYTEDFTNIISVDENRKFAVEDGEYEVTYWLEDANGQIVGSLQTESFTIDSKAPEVILTCNDNDQADKERISCTLVVTDDDFANCDVVVNVECVGVSATTTTTKDKDDIDFVGTTATITFTEEGKYRVSATATDKAGNSFTTDEVVFYIDRTKPVLSLKDSVGNDIVSGVYSTKNGLGLKFYVTEKNFGLVCDDNMKCAITYQKSGGNWKTMQASWTQSSVASEQDTWIATIDFADYATEEELYYIRFYVTDVGGNTATKLIRITVDNTGVSIEDLMVAYQDGSLGEPKCVTNNSALTYYLKDTAKVTFKVIEENAKGAVYVDTKKDGVSVDSKIIDITTEEQREKVTYSDEGYYVTSVYGEDEVGNEGETEEIRYVIDKTLPIPSILQIKNGVATEITENQLFAGANNSLRFVVKDDYYDLSQCTITVNLWQDGAFRPTSKILSGDDIAWNAIAGTNEVYYENSSLFEEEGRYTVTLKVKDLAGNEDSQRVSFYMDTTAPKISQKSNLKNGAYYNETVRFRYNVYEYNYDNATANITISRVFGGKTYQTTDSFDLSSVDETYEYLCDQEGFYTITVRAVDEAGNEGIMSGTQSVGYTISFTVDKTMPKLSIDGVTKGFKTPNAVTVNVHAKDCNHDFGKYYILVSRSDADGEIESFRIGNKITDYDVGSGWNRSGYIASLQNMYDSVRTLKFNKQGIYKLTLMGTDLAGNEAVENTISFTIDRTAPVISGITYSDEEGKLNPRHNKIYSKHAILVEFVVTDTIVGVDKNNVYVTVGSASERTDKTQIYVANKSIGNNYYVYVPTDLKVKNFSDSITIWASDLLGNQVNLETSDIIYKTSKAMISMECDMDYSKWTNQDVVFDTKVTDDVAGLKKIVYKVNGNEVKTVTFKKLTYSYESQVVASESADKVTGYTVSVEVTNNCDTVQTAKRQVYIDKEKPKIVLSGVEHNKHYPTAQIFTTNVSEVSYNKTKTVYYVSRTLDGKTSTVPLSNLKSATYDDSCVRRIADEGKYEIYAIATDAAGNKKRSNTLSFVVDKTAPVVQISGVSDGSVHTGSVSLDFSCVESFYETNDVTIEVERTLDGQVTGTTIDNFTNVAKKSSMSRSFTEDGSYKVTISAKDKAGNTANPQTLAFVIDNTKPVIRIEGTDDYQLWAEDKEIRFVVEESYYANNRITIEGTRTDINGKVENIPIPQISKLGKISQLSQVFSKDGIYELEITSQDEAGNLESKLIHFTIDKTNPVIQDVIPLDGGYYHSFKMAESLNGAFKDLTVISYRILLNGVEYNGTDLIEKEGKYNLYIEVEDELGHNISKMVEFIIDHTPPKVIFTGVQNAEVVTESGEVTLALTNTDDTIKAIRINGKEQDVEMRSFAYTEYGDYHIEVDCEDRAGNAITRELQFVYTNPTFLFGMGASMAVIFVSSVAVVWVRMRRKEKEDGDI